MIEFRSIKIKGGFCYTLGPGKYVIGRGSGSDIGIEDKTVSRRHAVLEVTDTGGVYLTDLSSQNGSFQNQRPVVGKSIVNSGDLLAFGGVECTLRLVGSPAPVGPDVTLSEEIPTIPVSGVVSLDEARRLEADNELYGATTVAALAQLGSLLVGGDAPERLYETGLRLLTESIKTQRAFILYYDRDKRDVSLWASYFVSPAKAQNVTVPRTIIEQALEKNAVVLVSELEMERKFAAMASVRDAGTRSALAMPLLEHDEPLAVLYTDTANEQTTLGRHHQQVFTVFGDMIAAKMSNWRLVSENEKKAVVEKELEVTKAKQKEIEEAYKQLAEAQDSLLHAEKMASLGRFVAGIAHEMNTPLGALLGSLGTVKLAGEKVAADLERMAGSNGHADSPSVDKKQLGRFLEAITGGCKTAGESAERIAAAVKALRTFARLDEPDLGEANFNECVEAALALLAHEFGEGVEIFRDFGDLPLVRCAVRDLNQVFFNVLRNAFEAVEGAGTITIVTQCRGENIVVTVHNTGPAIPPDELPKIFDPGFTTKGVRYGLGLGLSTAYRIVRAHGGTIEVSSETGRGTRFSIFVPAKYPRKT